MRILVYGDTKCKITISLERNTVELGLFEVIGADHFSENRNFRTIENASIIRLRRYIHTHRRSAQENVFSTVPKLLFLFLYALTL